MKRRSGRPLRQVQSVNDRSHNQDALFNTSVTCAHASNYGAVSLNRDPTAENHDSAMGGYIFDLVSNAA